MANAIIRNGDLTSHGGTVLEGFATLNVLGKNAAGVGHMVLCPKCKGSFRHSQGERFLGEKSGLSEVYEGKGI